MTRHRALAFAVLALGALMSTVRAESPATPESCPILQRFLSVGGDRTPTQYRALRHLEARNDKFDRTAWLRRLDRRRIRHIFVHRRCPGRLGLHSRSRPRPCHRDREEDVDRAAAGARRPDTGELRVQNRGPCNDGLFTLGVKARRKDMLLVDGSISFTRRTGSWLGLRVSLPNRHRSGPVGCRSSAGTSGSAASACPSPSNRLRTL